VTDQLLQYPWPGNIRELQNVLERAIVLTTGNVIERIDLGETEPDDNGTQDRMRVFSSVPFRAWLKSQEKQYLIQQLAIAEGRIGLTARNCGMNVKTLYRKMCLHGLHKRDLH
jgi:DNA-binding NtrC family response regulator